MFSLQLILTAASLVRPVVAVPDPVAHLGLVDALGPGPAVEVLLGAVLAVELVTEVRAVHAPVTHAVLLAGLAERPHTAGLGDAGPGAVSLCRESLALEVVQQTGGNVAVTGGHEFVTEGRARRDYLVIVADRLDRLTQQLVRQRVTARVHNGADHVDDQVDLPHGGVAEHVGVGGDVVRQVGAVPGLERNTLPRERSIQQTTHIKARGHLSFGLLVEHSLSVRLQMVSPLSL